MRVLGKLVNCHRNPISLALAMAFTLMTVFPAVHAIAGAPKAMGSGDTLRQDGRSDERSMQSISWDNLRSLLTKKNGYITKQDVERALSLSMVTEKSDTLNVDIYDYDSNAIKIHLSSGNENYKNVLYGTIGPYSSLELTWRLDADNAQNCIPPDVAKRDVENAGWRWLRQVAFVSAKDLFFENNHSNRSRVNLHFEDSGEYQCLADMTIVGFP